MCIRDSANTVMEPIHDRMPVIISQENWKDWLAEPVDKIEGMVAAYPDAEMQAWPVSRRVSKTVDDDRGLIEQLRLSLIHI